MWRMLYKKPATKLVDRGKASSLPEQPICWINTCGHTALACLILPKLKDVFRNAVKKRVVRFRGPRHVEVRDLVFDVVGHQGLIQSWDQGESQKALDAFVEKRNQIAHGEDIPYVVKSDLENYIRTVSSIALATDNWICDQLKSSVGKRPWNKVSNQTSKKPCRVITEGPCRPCWIFVIRV